MRVIALLRLIDWLLRQLLQMLTGSLDTTAALWDIKTLERIKTYETNIPVRAVSISPYNDHIILAGGQVRQHTAVANDFCSSSERLHV